MKAILYTILSVVMLTACSRELSDEPATPKQGEQVEVSFGASLLPEGASQPAIEHSAESPATRAQVPFAEPQHGFIYIQDKYGQTIGDPIALKIAVGGAMTTQPEKVTLTLGTKYTFRSVVCSQSDAIPSATLLPMYSLKKEGECPDLLYATTTQTVSVGTQVQFTYNHLYGKVKFVLSPGNNMTADELRTATLDVSGYYPEGTFDITTGKITTEPFETPVSVEKEAIYYAIPQTFASGAEATAKVTIDSKIHIGKITKGDIKANKLTTVTIEVTGGLKPIPTAKMGDFYMNDGTWLPGSTELTAEQKAACIGIVFKMGRDSGFDNDICEYRLKNGITPMNIIRGYVLALYDANDGNACTWASDHTFVGTNQYPESFRGYENTNIIKAFAKTANKTLQTDFPATYYATDGYETTHPAPDKSSGWFLSSSGQCQYWFDNKGVLLASIRKVIADSNWAQGYWSSSERYFDLGSHALYLDVSSGNMFLDDKLNDKYVRSILVF